MIDRNVETEILDAFECLGDGSRTFKIVHLRYVSNETTPLGERRFVGAQRWQTADGQEVRQIDTQLYEIITTKELLLRQQ